MPYSAVTMTNPLQDIRDALRNDALALQALDAALDNLSGEVAKTVDLIAGMGGRLILTGLGKSGHIAAKLAATFSSTRPRQAMAILAWCSRPM